MPAHTEHAFETAIEAGLLDLSGYVKRSPNEFDAARSLFSSDVVGFLKDSQPKMWASIESVLGSKTESTVLETLAMELGAKGSLHVLRHGFKCYSKTFRLAYFRPNSSLNPETAALYAKNRLTLTRQVRFNSAMKKPSGGNRQCVIDVTLSVNGLPVVTAELKNPLTGQRAADAVMQYRSDRDDRDLFFSFKKRTLVHFAVDPDEVWMTTRLAGKDTVFLPFNRGNGHGAGNPPVEGNWKTHYLWDEVLQADSLLDILQRFMHLEKKDRKVKTDKGTRTISRETMIFPRYHQLDAVRKLISDAASNGPGRNYLVQHSAGSGKSNSIAWLAHRLANLHDAENEKVFNSVIVVTDRRVLDQQLQKTIHQFEHKTGVVVKIDEDTQQLVRALSQNTPIIITTIQKFPFIAQAMETLAKKGVSVSLDTAGRRFAVIVDEAHSSQSGETSAALRGLLNKDGIESAVAAQFMEDDDVDPSDETQVEALKEAFQRARQPNLSFFAFTATPKFKTKILFDEPGPSGTAPFHEYSMRQAIEENFIMDVLQNYTTYKRFTGLVRTSEDDPEVPKREAAKAFTRYVELHPVNIEQVVSVIIEHFRQFVMHELGGRAKAMVVTGSRLAAVKYKKAFDRYVKENHYGGIRSLVAFSGTVEDPDFPDAALTEVSMNDGLAESALPETFDGENYRVLIVAEKYQTGFDQPLLQTMYVVKRLAGVQAVQTLSRLNRMAPGKQRTFVLDFANEEQDIYEAFKPYYESTPIGDNADPHRLNQLQHTLLEFGVFSDEDIEKFAAVWYRPKREHSNTDHKALNSALDTVVERFVQFDRDVQDEIRGQLTAYRNLYAFLSQVIPYHDIELEKLYAFVRNLLMKLPPPGDGQGYALENEIALRYFRIQQMTNGSIDLSEGELEPLKGPTDVGTARRDEEAVVLSSLIRSMNERFGTEFTEADQLFFDSVQTTAENDDKIVKAANANSLDNFSSYFDGQLDELFIKRMEGNDDIFNRVMADKSFRAMALEHLSREI